MKVGIAINCSRKLDEIVREVQDAERLAFDCAWVADVGLNRDIYVALTTCALRTSSISLGTSVTNPYTRHPAISAAAFATLDEISGGRMIIGLGIGSKRNVLEPLGITRRNIEQTCREAVGVMRQVLSGERADYSGQLFRLRNAKIGFKARRTIPIYLAGRGRKMLVLAGEVADGVMFSSLTTPEAVSYAMNAIDEGAEKAGRDSSTIEKALFARVSIHRNGWKARDEVRPHVPYRIWDDNYQTLRQLGYDWNVVSRIKALYNKGNVERAASLVTDQMLEDFAIAGTARECARKIEQLGACGVTHLIVSPVHVRRSARRMLLTQLSRMFASGSM